MFISLLLNTYWYPILFMPNGIGCFAIKNMFFSGNMQHTCKYIPLKTFPLEIIILHKGAGVLCGALINPHFLYRDLKHKLTDHGASHCLVYSIEFNRSWCDKVYQIPYWWSVVFSVSERILTGDLKFHNSIQLP